MKRFSLRLEDELHEKLRRESFVTERSINEIITELIEEKYKEDLNMKNEKFRYETVSQGRVCEYKVYFKGKYVTTTFDNQVNGEYSILRSDSSGYDSFKIVGDNVFLHCNMEGKHGAKDKDNYYYFKDGDWIEDKSKSIKRFF